MAAAKGPVNPDPSPADAGDVAAPLNGWLRRNTLLIACAVAVALKIWLVLSFGLRAGGNADADDRLFLVLAESILNGEWLGDYNRFTLVKGPFYSIWIAGAFLAHIPVTLSYQFLHIAACVLLLVALKPQMPSSLLRLGLFVVLLFDPSTYSAVASWIVRDGVYLSQAILIVACIAALLLRLDRKPRNLVGWSVGLGLVLAAFWTTREEGIWILPGAGIALVYALVQVWQAREAVIAKSTLLILPAVLCAAGVLGVCALNQRYYGMFEVVDITSDGFARANGALMRVHHEQWNQFANVPKDVRTKVYAVSPSFAELEYFLEGPPGVAWGRAGEAWLVGGTPSPQDIRGGFFLWALRQAAEQRGYYRTAQSADAYFGRIADEINAACGDGRLQCDRARASISPPWRAELNALAVKDFWRGMRMMARLDDVTVFNMPSAGTEAEQLIFEDLGRMRINPDMGDTTAPRLGNQARLDELRWRQLSRLNTAYKAVAPYLTVVAAVAFFTALVLELRQRSLSPVLIVLVVLLASIGVRLAVLTLISITSFDAMRLRYFLPLYPMLLLFWFLSIQHAIALISTRRQTNMKPETP